MSVEYSGAGVLELMASAKNYNRFLADLVESALRGSQTCLDFGAGDGTMTRLVAERGLRPACVEQDAGFRERLRAGGFDARAAVTDFAPGSIEGAYSLNVLEHIEAHGPALERVRGLLASNGRLLVTVPNGFGWFEADQRLFERVIEPIDRRLRLIRLVHGVKQLFLGDRIVPGFPSTLADGVSPHVQWFSARTIARVLEENGFEVLSLEGGTLASGPCIDLAITGIRPATAFNGFLGRMCPRMASGFRIVARARQDSK
jgi:SAM-dependent methyltransferase